MAEKNMVNKFLRNRLQTSIILKKITTVLFLLSYIVQTVYCFANIPESKVYKVGGDENFPPYEYVIETEGVKNYRGFNVDVMKAIALETGIENW